MPAPESRSNPESNKPTLISHGAKAALIVVVVALLIWLGREGGAYIPRFSEWVHRLGPWGPVAFILGYAVATVAFIPGSLLTLAAGAIFGLLGGTLYVFIGATLGASGAFLIARYVARSAIEAKLEERPKFRSIDRAIARQGLKIVALLRLSPIFPFNLLNYALGLTRVRFLDYLIACAAMLPGTFLYVYYGKAIGSLAALAAGAHVEKGTGYWTVFALGLAATAVVTALITRVARRALNQEVEDDSPTA